MKQRFILTGTPGAGKTALIRALEAQNYSVVEEAATDVITLEQAKGNSEPWLDVLFIDKIISLQVYRQKLSDLQPHDVCFYDRSPLCTYALCQYLDFAPSNALIEEIKRIQNTAYFHKTVFFIENLGYIHNTDARKINISEAIRFEVIHKNVYEQFGYTLKLTPPESIEKRTHMILEMIRELNNKG